MGGICSLWLGIGIRLVGSLKAPPPLCTGLYARVGMLQYRLIIPPVGHLYRGRIGIGRDLLREKGIWDEMWGVLGQSGGSWVWDRVLLLM